MKRWMLTIVTLLALAAPAWGQEVLLPPEVRGPANFPIVVAPLKVDGGDVRWRVGPGLGQFDFSRLYDFGPDAKQKGIAVYGPNGTYEVWAVVAKDDKVSPFAVAKVVIGTGLPDPPPGPPVPPKPPGPPDPPVPPVPILAPIAIDGLAVLMIEESTDRATLPIPQYSMIFDKEFRAWLSTKCAQHDGKAAWIISDKDDERPKVWADALARSRKQIPWIIVSNPRKGGGYEGPLPANVTEAKALISKFAD